MQISHLHDISQAATPEELREVVMDLGFTSFLFQRWYPDVMDNWETGFAPGFLGQYYGSQIYKSCPVAIAIHAWSRNFTFKEARAEILVGSPEAQRATDLLNKFGLVDGAVFFSGSNSVRSAMIVASEREITAKYDDLKGTLSFAAQRLELLLPTGHSLLTQISRDDPVLSEMQNKILRHHIENPNLSYTEVAEQLGISPKTLLAHHKKIAKKTGVASFTGAIVKTLRGQESI